MKLILVFVGIVILSYSCQVGKHDLDISDYYFDLNKFDSPKVYQYNSEVNGVKSYIYNKLTKVNSKDLLFEQYNGSFKIINRTIMEYTSKGVKYKEVWVSNPKDNGNLYQQSIIDSLVFPFNLKDSPIEFKAEGMPDDEIKIVSIVKNQLSEPKDTVIKDIKTKIIFGYGERTWKVTSAKIPISSKEMKTKDIVIYQKGLGVIFMKTYSGNSELFKMELNKILTIEEFEENKNAAYQIAVPPV